MQLVCTKWRPVHLEPSLRDINYIDAYAPGIRTVDRRDEEEDEEAAAEERSPYEEVNVQRFMESDL